MAKLSAKQPVQNDLRVCGLQQMEWKLNVNDFRKKKQICGVCSTFLMAESLSLLPCLSTGTFEKKTISVK